MHVNTCHFKLTQVVLDSDSNIFSLLRRIRDNGDIEELETVLIIWFATVTPNVSNTFKQVSFAKRKEIVGAPPQTGGKDDRATEGDREGNYQKRFHPTRLLKARCHVNAGFLCLHVTVRSLDQIKLGDLPTFNVHVGMVQTVGVIDIKAPRKHQLTHVFLVRTNDGKAGA